ncbi:molybdenum cofactor guanylyltransferase [Cryobacterium melibiosiphilum]|uniref:Molybdenum cofactor guanylyltransferase n=1 Tax=Cryobacterium melibiosiphilum TaxID=995039 RepID=A0A3A5ML80_9MICO|nr:DUF6457 domain-containing protein [Cryobacterium melibiosiphilum]RJT90860.1 molybdenum cofactor guanylyltransferase [Cryobacterium melibiosiphilum]
MISADPATPDSGPTGPTSPTDHTGPRVDLIVLAGGRGSRLGGALKPAVEVAGRSLLSRVLDARPFARHTVVVGPESARPGGASSARPADASATIWTLEDPPFGGPVAGIAAGLAALPAPHPADWILLLACDLPWAADAAPRLIEAARAADLPPTVDGLHLIDETGHAQWLVAIYRGRQLAASVARLGSDVRGASMRALLGGLELRALPDLAGSSRDVDTWQDVADTTELLRTTEFLRTTEHQRGAAPAAPARPPGDPMSTPEPGTAKPDALPPEALDAWLFALATKLGLDPDEIPVGLLLDVARDVAHNVARPAAPLSTFLVGLAAAQNGGTAADIEDAAALASELALAWTPPKL